MGTWAPGRNFKKTASFSTLLAYLFTIIIITYRLFPLIIVKNCSSDTVLTLYQVTRPNSIYSSQKTTIMTDTNSTVGQAMSQPTLSPGAGETPIETAFSISPFDPLGKPTQASLGGVFSSDDEEMKQTAHHPVPSFVTAPYETAVRVNEDNDSCSSPTPDLETDDSPSSDESDSLPNLPNDVDFAPKTKPARSRGPGPLRSSSVAMAPSLRALPHPDSVTGSLRGSHRGRRGRGGINTRTSNSALQPIAELQQSLSAPPIVATAPLLPKPTKTDRYLQTCISWATRLNPAPLVIPPTTEKPVTSLPVTVPFPPTGYMTGIVVIIPSKLSKRQALTVEGSDGCYYQIDFNSFSPEDLELLDRRQHFLPLVFKPVRKTFASTCATIPVCPAPLEILNHCVPPAVVTVYHAKEAKIITAINEAGQTLRTFFQVMEKSELPPSRAPTKNIVYLRVVSHFGVGKYPLQVLERDLPADRRSALSWFTAHLVCVPKTGVTSRDHGFPRIVNALPSRSFDIEHMPFTLHQLFDAPRVFEDSFLTTITGTLYKKKLHLLLGSPAPLNLPQLLSIPFSKATTNPSSAQGIRDMLVAMLEQAYHRDGASKEEGAFLHSQLSKTRLIPTTPDFNFLCHYFDSTFKDNLKLCSRILSSFANDLTTTGLILYPTDHITVSDCSLYVTHPNLTQLLVNCGLAFSIWSPDCPTRLPYMKGLTKISKSHMSKTYLIIQLVMGSASLYPGLIENDKISTGQIIPLPSVNPISTLNLSDEGSAGSSNLSPSSSEVESLQLRVTDEVVISFYLDPSDNDTKELTLNGTKALCAAYGRRFTREQKLEDVTLGIKFQQFVLSSTPSETDLHCVLSSIPHIWIKPTDSRKRSKLTLLQFRPTCGPSYFLQICEGLRCLPGITALFPDGHGALLLGPIDEPTLYALVDSLRESCAVDFYVHKGDLIIGNDNYGGEFYRAMFPPPPVPILTKVVVCGLSADVDLQTIKDIILEVRGDPTTAYWAQDKQDRPGVLFTIPGVFSLHTAPKFHTYKARSFFFAHTGDFTNVGQACFPLQKSNTAHLVSHKPADTPFKGLADVMAELRIKLGNINDPDVRPKWHSKLSLYDKFIRAHGSQLRATAPSSQVPAPLPEAPSSLSQLPLELPRAEVAANAPTDFAPGYSVMEDVAHTNDLVPVPGVLLDGSCSLTTSCPSPNLCSVLNCTALTLNSCSSPACVLPLCPTHILTSCPHKLCHIGYCTMFGTTLCHKCALLHCATHANVSCTLKHAGKCSYPLCRSTVETVCSSSPACAALLCSEHNLMNLPCPHNLCSFCPSTAYALCNVGKTPCKKPLCPTHKKTPCPTHTVMFACGVASCRLPYWGTCSTRSCAMALCNRHFTQPCPSHVNLPSRSSPSSPSASLKRRASTSAEPDIARRGMGLMDEAP